MDAKNVFIQNNKIDIFCIQQRHRLDYTLFYNWLKFNQYDAFLNNKIPTKTNPNHVRAGTCYVLKPYIKDNFKLTHQIIEKSKIHVLALEK